MRDFVDFLYFVFVTLMPDIQRLRFLVYAIVIFALLGMLSMIIGGRIL